MRSADDVRELYKLAPPIISAILSACKAVGYTYKTKFDGRITELVPRGGRNRPTEGLFGINSKALFIFKEKDAIEKLDSLLISTIIERATRRDDE